VTVTIALVLLALLPANPARIDERFSLAIASRTIANDPYDTSLEIGFDRPITLRIGAAVHANRIRADLRGISGDVRFHADLTPLTTVIDRHPSHKP